MVKNPPAVKETQFRSPGWEDSWRRKWQPTPEFLFGKSHGQRSLATPHGVPKELDTIWRLNNYKFWVNLHSLGKSDYSFNKSCVMNLNFWTHIWTSLANSEQNCDRISKSQIAVRKESSLPVEKICSTRSWCISLLFFLLGQKSDLYWKQWQTNIKIQHLFLSSIFKFNF